MKTYTLEQGKFEAGIRVYHSPLLCPFPFIAVGEAGRGRLLIKVPLPRGSVVNWKEPAPPRTGVAVEIPPRVDRPEDKDSVVVLIEDHSGFRGSWKLCGAVPVEEVRKVFAFRKEHEALEKEGGWEAVRKGGHEPILDCEKCILPAPPHPLRVVAEGRRAQGEAGRAGGGPVFLVVMKPGTAFEIRRTGRLYGDPDILRVEFPAPGAEPVIIDVRSEVDSLNASF